MKVQHLQERVTDPGSDKQVRLRGGGGQGSENQTAREAFNHVKFLDICKLTIFLFHYNINYDHPYSNYLYYILKSSLKKDL